MSRPTHPDAAVPELGLVPPVEELHRAPAWFRLVEIGSIVAFFSMSAALVWRVWPHIASSPWLIAGSLFVGFLAADFTSGFVHWLGDTWGTVDMPILGRSLIRPFREHHVDQKAMTRHDYVETNGANCMISLPWALGALVIPFDAGEWKSVAIGASVSIFSMIFFVMLTNQFHKWAHLEEHELSPVVVWLQRLHLILPPAHHRIHHASPHEVCYSITTGWLNRPLDGMGFYRRSERLVTWVTGLVPRQEDAGIQVAAAGREKSPSSEHPASDTGPGNRVSSPAE